MASLNALQLMRVKPKTMAEEEFDRLMIPHWTYYLHPMDVEELRKIATSKRLSGNMSEKLRRIKAIMNYRGFVKFAGGTNRVVYRHLEDPRFLAKIAIDSVGMSDNPAEYNNQWLLRPYCTRMFHVTPCGTVGFAERVLPITSKQEFKTAADDIFEMLYCKIIGKYIIEDVGTNYFMNYGIKPGVGPVLLDYPYVYELDGASIYCQNILPNNTPCGGEIDYDDGLNNLVCKRCGRKYLAREMKKNISYNKIVISKGGNVPMNVSIKKGNAVIAQSNSCNFIVKPTPSPRAKIDESIKTSGMKACLVKNGKVLTSQNQKSMEGPAQFTMEQIRDQIRKNTQLENASKNEEKKAEEEVVVNSSTMAITPEPEVEEKVEEKEEQKVEAKEDFNETVNNVVSEIARPDMVVTPAQAVKNATKNNSRIIQKRPNVVVSDGEY